ncbi:MAG: UDP-2,4-diacetamido-2,4,6-trideoxy-beta-L-altropyranose hydrolase [Alteromonadaceae bacterium]|nr:MAG: UDP-2,4-diacetamido-2,4,6-trideoxy-beta-L-altropyranose hydrolase [Alteromonadaceae bacterium]
MNIVFRADASAMIGNGHMVRCLTLASKLRQLGHDCCFVMCADENNSHRMIECLDFDCFLLPSCELTDIDQQSDAEATLAMLSSLSLADCVVVDHYQISAIWHMLVNAKIANIVVIDDLFDRDLYCHLLIDQTYQRQAEQYQPRLKRQAKLCLGTEYALLRDDFATMRPQALARRQEPSKIKSVLLSMGGTDSQNDTLTIIQWLLPNLAAMDLNLTVVLAGNAPHRLTVEAYVKGQPCVNLLSNVKDMAGLVCNHDIAIGAMGTSTWERCCLGLPTIAIITADNQRDIAVTVAEAGAVLLLGHMSDLTEASFNAEFSALSADVQRYQTMSEAGFAICDGSGAERSAVQIVDLLQKNNTIDTKEAPDVSG